MKLFTKEILLFFSPIIFILSTYIILDPYCVIHANKSNAINSVCSDYIKTNQYVEQYVDSNFTHYIFGNSRTIGISQAYKNYTTKKTFDFHNPGESILNIYKKIKLIDALEQEIKGCIILLDDDLIKNFNNTNIYYQGPEYLHHPLTSDHSYIQFHKKLLQYFLSDWFWLKRLDFAITNNYKAYMKDAFGEPGTGTSYAQLESIIKKDSVQFYKKYQNKFKDISPGYSDVQLAAIDLDRFQDIKRIFDHHKTEYFVIIGPNYNQKQMNDATCSKIQSIFGKQHVYDFSGTNDITTNKGNYYESSHYRPHVGNIILKTIQNEKTPFNNNVN